MQFRELIETNDLYTTHFTFFQLSTGKGGGRGGFRGGMRGGPRGGGRGGWVDRGRGGYDRGRGGGRGRGCVKSENHRKCF